MEEKLNAYLRKNEQVLWQGQPESFPLLDNGSRAAILRKWALTVIVASCLVAGYVPNHHGEGMGFVIAVLACSAILLLTPVLEMKGNMKCRYWITNQRVIQMTKDKVFYYMDLADVDDVAIVKDKTVTDSLAVGSAAFRDAQKYIRWRACHPMEDPEAAKGRDHVDGMIMYNIGGAEAAAALLRKLGCGSAA